MFSSAAFFFNITEGGNEIAGTAGRLQEAGHSLNISMN